MEQAGQPGERRWPSAAIALNLAMPAIPVILFSGYFADDLIQRAGLSPNVTTSLVKPISEADLQAAIPVAVTCFRELRALSEEATFLRQSLEDRKVIEK